jgi:hypothetical protein
MTVPVLIPISEESNVGVLGVLDSLRNQPDNLSRAETVATSPYKFEVFAMAAKYLKMFFADKKDREGKEIPRAVIVTTDHLSIVLNTEMSSGFDAFYEIIQKHKDIRKGEEIKYLVALLHDARRLTVPQSLIMGIACIHAKLVGQFEPAGIFAVDRSLTDLMDVIEKEDLEDDWDDEFEGFGTRSHRFLQGLDDDDDDEDWSDLPEIIIR